MLAVCAIVLAGVACSLGGTAALPTPAPGVVVQGPTRTLIPAFPSITPLFGAQAAPRTAIPFGVAIPTLPPAVATAQAVSQPVATQDRSGVLLQPGVIVVTATPVPGTITVPAGQIGSTVGTLLTSMFGLATGFLNTSWTFVGAQGGWLLQLVCCVIPFILALGYVFRRGMRIFR